MLSSFGHCLHFIYNNALHKLFKNTITVQPVETEPCINQNPV